MSQLHKQISMSHPRLSQELVAACFLSLDLYHSLHGAMPIDMLLYRNMQECVLHQGSKRVMEGEVTACFILLLEVVVKGL